MKDGVFRYDLSDVVTRTVPGRYGIIAMVGVYISLQGNGHCVRAKCTVYIVLSFVM